jgi:hypothetical protein
MSKLSPEIRAMLDEKLHGLYLAMRADPSMDTVDAFLETLSEEEIGEAGWEYVDRAIGALQVVFAIIPPTQWSPPALMAE